MTNTTAATSLHPADQGRQRNRRNHDGHDDRELYYRLDAHFVDIRPVGPVPDGLRMNGHFEGTITAGDDALIGAEVAGVDYYRVRLDGVGVVDAHEVITIGGRTVGVRLTGYVLPPEGQPVPTIEEMLSPDFSYPDVGHQIEAFATFQAGASELEHLNRVSVVHTGTVNFATGKITVFAHRLY
jgi:hypothetical protein